MGLKLRLWSAATGGHIVHPPDDMSVESEGGMIYWKGKTEELREKPVPVPLCPPQISHGLTWERTLPSAATNRLSHGTALYICEVPVSNLGLKTSYPDWGFPWFFSDSPGECRDSTLTLGDDRFLPNPFKFVIHLSPYYLTLYSLS
jgi:hypothetical protein